MELASLYTVPLSAVNGLSRLTKLTTSKEQARSNHFRRSLGCEFDSRPLNRYRYRYRNYMYDKS